jgi:hypothetical protein
VFGIASMNHQRRTTMSRRLLYALPLLLAWPAAPARAGERLTPETFGRLHRLIKPQPGESKWARVPWLTNLAEARKKAVAQDKPLLVWRSGGGDVLGRT